MVFLQYRRNDKKLPIEIEVNTFMRQENIWFCIQNTRLNRDKHENGERDVDNYIFADQYTGLW